MDCFGCRFFEEIIEAEKPERIIDFFIELVSVRKLRSFDCEFAVLDFGCCILHTQTAILIIHGKEN